jgi:cytochrome c oxidase subunit 2
MPRSTKLLTAAGILLLAAFVAPAASAQEGADLERGEQLFVLCTQCHGDAGEGMPMALAPAIAGLEAWYVEAQLEKFQKGWRGGHPDDIAGMRMRPMSLWLDTNKDTHEDRKAVAAYVASLPPADPAPTLGGDAERGKTLYAPCTACHGTEGKGNQTLNAPSLVHSSDWYLVRSLEKYKSGVRGWSAEDGTAQVMRGMSMSLVDEQAMKDVVAYIMSLRGSSGASTADAAQTQQ